VQQDDLAVRVGQRPRRDLPASGPGPVRGVGGLADELVPETGDAIDGRLICANKSNLRAAFGRLFFEQF